MKVELSDDELETLVVAGLRSELAARLDAVRLVSVETAAALLDVSVNTFKTIADQAGVTPVRFPGSRVVRWRLADLERFTGHGPRATREEEAAHGRHGTHGNGIFP